MIVRINLPPNFTMLFGFCLVIFHILVYQNGCESYKLSGVRTEHPYYEDLDILVNDYIFRRIVTSLDDKHHPKDDNNHSSSATCFDFLKDHLHSCVKCINQRCSEQGSVQCTSKHLNISHPDPDGIPKDSEEISEQKHGRSKRGIGQWFLDTWETLKGSVVKVVHGLFDTGKGLAEVGDGLEDVITPAYKAVKELMGHVAQNGGILLNASTQLFRSYDDCIGFQECYNKSMEIMSGARDNLKNTELAQTLEDNMRRLREEYGRIVGEVKRYPELKWRLESGQGRAVNNGSGEATAIPGNGKVARMEMATAVGAIATGFALDFFKVWTECEGLENCQVGLREVFKRFDPAKISFLGTEISGFLEEVKKTTIRIAALAFDSEFGKSIKRVLRDWFERGKSFIRKIFDFIKRLFGKASNPTGISDGVALAEGDKVDLESAYKGIDQVMSEEGTDSYYYTSVDGKPYQDGGRVVNKTSDDGIGKDSFWENILLQSYPDATSDNDFENDLGALWMSPWKSDSQPLEIIKRSAVGRSDLENSVESVSRDSGLGRGQLTIEYSDRCNDGEAFRVDCTYRIGVCNECKVEGSVLGGDAKECLTTSVRLDELLHNHGWLSQVSNPLYSTENIKWVNNVRSGGIHISSLKFNVLGHSGVLKGLDIDRPTEDILQLVDTIGSKIWQKILKH